MFRSYSITCNSHFDHKSKEAHCTARLIYQDNHMTTIRFYSDINGPYYRPVTYSLCEYDEIYWVVNLDERSTVFIHNPLDPASAANDLLDFDSLEEEEAEELAEMLRFFYRIGLPKTDDDIIDDDYPYLEDNELPF